MRMRHAAVVAGLALGLMSGAAKAAYIVDIEQVDANVVVTGSGSISTSSFDFETNGLGIASYIYSGDDTLVIGRGVASAYSGFYFPTFGSSPVITRASSNTGSIVGFQGDGELFVPRNYSSGTPLGISTATFENTTIAGLGLTAGSSYNYFFPGDLPESTDSFTINIGGISPVPLPASAPMFGAAVLALGAVGYGVKRKKAAAAA